MLSRPGTDERFGDNASARASLDQLLRPPNQQRHHVRIVEDWLEPVIELNMSLGLQRRQARAHARLGVAVTRGLLLDLLATRDVAAVDDAMDAFIDVYTTWLERAATP